MTTPAPTESKTGWSRPGWLSVVICVFVIQLAFIWVLGTHRKPPARQPSFVPPVKLVSDVVLPLAELADPTLFVLPHIRGFSGQAWARTPRREFVSSDWDEPFRWRPVAVEKLGEGFRELAASAALPPMPVAEKTESSIPLLETSPVLFVRQQSTLAVGDELAARPIVQSPQLPSWPGSEILAASEVRVVVDVEGRVVSAGLMRGNISSHPEQSRADQEALELALLTRFQPSSAGNGLTIGKLVFQWHTSVAGEPQTQAAEP